MSRSSLGVPLAACLGSTLMLACHDSPSTSRAQTETGTGTSPTSTSTTAVPPDSTATLTPTETTDAASTTGPGCRPVTVQVPAAQRPIGVVLLVDNTEGMTFEAAEVSTRLNDFAQDLEARADFALVLISAHPDVDPQGVCVDPPLGSGGCPRSDSLPPTYLHIDLSVTPLGAISDVFVTHPQWADVMPDMARRHLVVVSDGNTGVVPRDFASSFLMLDPRAHEDFRFHASVALRDCPEAAAVGTGFVALAEDRGGLVHDLCSQDYASFFDDLAAQVVADAADRCRWTLPPLPDGVPFDPEAVELRLELDGSPIVLPSVPSPGACDPAVPAWYWESEAYLVMEACPETCAFLSSIGRVLASVRFGCSGGTG